LQLTALASANKPSKITSIAKEQLETLKTQEEKKKWVMLAQSALIKAAFLCGMPKVKFTISTFPAPQKFAIKKI
jgi:hypothetical protein